MGQRGDCAERMSWIERYHMRILAGLLVLVLIALALLWDVKTAQGETFHAIGDSHVARGALDDITDHQDGFPGASCWWVASQMKSPLLEGHEGEHYFGLCGTNGAIAEIPLVDELDAIEWMADTAIGLDGPFEYISPPSPLAGSRYKAVIDDRIGRIHLKLPERVRRRAAHGEWIRRGNDQVAAFYTPDGGHLGALGNAEFARIVVALPEYRRGDWVVWLVVVVLYVQDRWRAGW